MKTPRRGLRPLIPLIGLLAVSLPAAAFGATLPGDDFEGDDGNLAITTAGNLDWNAVTPAIIVDKPSASNDSFTIGSQENNPSATWGTTVAPVNAKADVNRVYMRSQFPYLDLGIVRNQQANGTVAYHVELDQSTAKHANGLPVRTAGDVLVVYDFQGNSTTATLTLHRWITSGTCATNTNAPCWGVGTTLNATQAIGGNNAAQVSDAVVDPAQTLAAKTFDEMTIDLSAALGLGENRCVDFGQIWVKTREGGAFGSALQDLVGPKPVSVGNCDVKIEKDVVKVDGEAADNPASVPFGADLAYRIRVSLGAGSANIPADLLTVTDTTVSDTSLVGEPLTAVTKNGVVVGDDGDGILEPGEAWQYALDAIGTRVGQTASTCADVVNSATVAVDGGDTDPSNNTATRTIPVVCKPDLLVEKTADVKSVDFGGTVTYGITVKHAPGSDPLGIPVQSVTDTLGAQAGVGLVLAAGDVDDDQILDPSETWTYETANGPFSAVAGGCSTLANTATLAADGDVNPSNDTSSVSTPVICTLDVAIAKKADQAAYTPGQTITYTVTVTNTGQAPVPFSEIDVADPTLPNLVAVNPPATLEPGASVEYTGTRAVTVTDCGTVPNTATVRLLVDGLQVAETDPENNSASVSVPVNCTLDIAIAKSADKVTYAPGETITYTVTVTNTGQLPIPFSAIQVADPTLPALTPVGATPTTLGPDDSQVYTGTRTVGKADCGQVKNTATVALTGDLQAESSTANNTSSVTVSVEGALCNVVVGDPQTTLRITKIGPRSSQPRRAVPYRIRVTNTGAVVAKSVVLVDPIPSGMVLAKLPKGATLVKGKVRWNIGDLAVGQTVSFTVLIRTDVNATRTRCNIATAGAANARAVRGKTCTTFVRIAGAGRLPVVTG